MNESISLTTVLIAVAGIGVSIIAYFLKDLAKEVKQVPTLMHKIEIVALSVAEVSVALREAKPKLDQLTQFEMTMKAAHKRIDQQQKTIDALRERSHELSGWLMTMRARMEADGKEFKSQWVLTEARKDDE